MENEVEIERERNLMTLLNDLDIGERVKAREDYRDLICQAQNVTADGEAAFVDIHVINKGISETTRVFNSGRVLLPTEGTYDAEALRHYSELFRQKVLSQKDEALQFNSAEYALQLVQQIKALSGDGVSDGSEYPTISQWAEFGITVGSFFRRAPAFHYLYGSFARDDVSNELRVGQSQLTQSERAKERSENAAAKRKQKETAALRNDTARLTQPNTLEKASEVAENEETTKMVDLVWKRLRTVFNKNKKMPISYFEFVLDPNCFVQSMENMFYVSFLVKDGRAGIDLDEAGLPVLNVYENASEESDSTSGSDDYKQCVITMNKQTWKCLVEAYNVKEAVLNFNR